LIASGAETNTVSSQGWTALQKASFNHHAPVIKLFLSLLKDHGRPVQPEPDSEPPAQQSLA
jgi:ankyrin repeat protein